MGGERQLIHLNNNILCAMRTRISGPIPRYHDLVEICILPINSQWKPSTCIVPFSVKIQPKRKENIDYKSCPLSKEAILNICETGMDAYVAADRFDEWMTKLNLNSEKKIVLLCHDWVLDREFIIDWLGVESFNQFIDNRVRDIGIISLYANDKADFHAEPALYAKTHFSYIANSVGIQGMRSKDCMEESLTLIEIYKRMLANPF